MHIKLPLLQRHRPCSRHLRRIDLQLSEKINQSWDSLFKPKEGTEMIQSLAPGIRSVFSLGELIARTHELLGSKTENIELDENGCLRGNLPCTYLPQNEYIILLGQAWKEEFG